MAYVDGYSEREAQRLYQQAGILRRRNEEHRRILRDALLGLSKRERSFKDCLLSMPNVGEDKDFERGPPIERPVEL